MKPTIALVLISLVAASTAYSAGQPSSRAEAQATATQTAPQASYRQVRFAAADGMKLVGRLWGTGDVAVILAHGYSQSLAQDGWNRFVPSLVARGYTVLSFNFRGFCDSKQKCSAGAVRVGRNSLDAVAAVRFMEARGAKKVLLVGASMGGVASLHAARMPGVDVAGVVLLGTPQFPSKYYAAVPATEDATPARLRQIDEPKLFVAGTKDVQTNAGGELRPGIKRVSFAAEARRMFAAAEEPKELALIDSSFHSSDLLTDAPADTRKLTSGVVLRFLSENS